MMVDALCFFLFYSTALLLLGLQDISNPEFRIHFFNWRLFQPWIWKYSFGCLKKSPTYTLFTTANPIYCRSLYRKFWLMYEYVGDFCVIWNPLTQSLHNSFFLKSQNCMLRREGCSFLQQYKGGVIEYTKSLVNTNSFYTNFTNTHFQKVPIPHLTRTMKQKFLH